MTPEQAERFVLAAERIAAALTKAAVVGLAGDSVCPDVAREIVGANSFERWEAA